MASTIILSDNGASSGSAGLKSTAGNDGVLILQTTTSGGTATNAVYVNNSQNVGINTTPSAWGSGQTAIDFGSVGAIKASDVLSVANNIYYNGSNWIFKTSSYAALYDQRADGEHRMYATVSGTAGGTATPVQILAVNKAKTLSLENATPQSGTGITFPATQSASSDANTLDDYEEGSWTPTLSRSGLSITQDNQVGWYTKVGQNVTVGFAVRVTAIASQGSGQLALGPLPFVSSGGYGQCGAMGYNNVLNTAGTAATAMSGTSYINFNVGITSGEFNGSIGTGWISGTITYRV